MKECWNDDKESRPTFLELKKEFDGFISHEERYNYLLLDGAMAEAMESEVPALQCPKCSESGKDAEIVILESTA